MVKPEWKVDEYGNDRQSLFLGALYVGGVLLCVPTGWRDWVHLKGEEPGKTARREHFEKRSKTPWRAWFMSDESGDEIGWYATADEARAALEKHLHSALELT